MYSLITGKLPYKGFKPMDMIVMLSTYSIFIDGLWMMVDVVAEQMSLCLGFKRVSVWA